MQQAGDERMRRLLKYPLYVIVLALAVAIGTYIVLGSVSLEDIILSHPVQKAAAARLQPTPPASAEPPAAEAASAPTDNEQGYGVARGLEWFASYAQSATAKVEKLLFADVPDNAEVSTDEGARSPAAASTSASTDNEQGYEVAEWLASYAQSATAKVEKLLFANAPDNAEVSTDESARARAQRAADEGVLRLRRLAARDDPVLPAQAQAAGFTKLVFNSDFSTGLSLSNSGTWYNPGIWFQSAATGNLTPTDSEGVLNLSWSPGDAATGVTVGTMAPTGLSNTSWQYGYIELSMAFPPVTGIWPAIWMESDTATTSYVPTESNHSYSEVDIFVWQSQIPNTLNGGIHTWVAAAGAHVSDVQNNDGHNTASFPRGTNVGNFNTYGVLWTSSQISWYFNNTLVFSATATQYPQAFSVLSSGPMYLMLSNQAGANWQVGNSHPTSTADMKVQWVHVWGH
jgi:beta-glucanase (GH16 family)